MQSDFTQIRIIEAGINVDQVSKSSVLIKIGEISPKNLMQNPVWALTRGLAALGFGEIHLCGSPDYFGVLDELIQTGNFSQHPGFWLTQDIANASPQSNIIIDLTNEPKSESFCKQLAKDRSVPCLYTAWGDSWVAISPQEITAEELSRLHLLKTQTKNTIPPLGRMIAGLALQETVMLAGNLDLAVPLDRTVIYNAAAENRTTGPSRLPWNSHALVQNVVLEIVGAGAVSIHLLESLLPLLGDQCEVRIFDFDKFSLENAPFSYCADSDIGRAKADVTAERMSNICHPSLSIRPFVMAYQERPQELSLPSARIICADNFKVRHYANEQSVFVDKVPLVEAGCSTLSGQQRTYWPGRTACLNHQHRIYNLGKKADEEERSTSCSLNRALTLPGTNMIIGGILAIESLKVIDTIKFGIPSRGTIVYDATSTEKFKVVDELQPCEH